jgi:putative transposase
MSDRLTDDLTLDALGMALARRRPPHGLLHHSDRGSQPSTPAAITSGCSLGMESWAA